MAAVGVTLDCPQGPQIGNLVSQVLRTAVSFGISLKTYSDTGIVGQETSLKGETVNEQYFTIHGSHLALFIVVKTKGSDTDIHINVIPSGEVKDSDVCCVCAYNQVRLAHTEKHRVALCLGES